MKKEVVTRTATISLLKENIIRIVLHKECYLEREHLAENHRAENELAQQRPHFVLVDTNGASGSKEAREFGAGPEPARYRLGEAIIIRSLAGKIMGNGYLRINKPKVPTRLFSNESSALKWLESLQQRVERAH